MDITNRWKLVKIEAQKGVYHIEDGGGKKLICKVNNKKLKFPKGINPPEYIVKEIEHFLENSGMVICDSLNCPHANVVDRDNLNNRGYVVCNHEKGVLFNVARGNIRVKQTSEGYFRRDFCKLSLCK